MSKVTVITDAKGQIQAIGHGHLSEAANKKNGPKGARGGLRPLPDQKLHEIEVAEDVSQLKDWRTLHEKIRPHVKATA